MKIVFVHLGREHLGIEYLSSILKKQGHKVELVCDQGLFSREDNVFYSPFLERFFREKDLVKKIITAEPDLVAFSPYTTTYQWACGLAKELKEHTSVPIVFGGIHSTLVPKVVIKNSFVDFVIVGEAEEAFPELVENLGQQESLKKIKNLWLKEDGEIITNQLRLVTKDLDKLPLPDKELFAKYVRFKDDYMIMTSRGCHFSCSFCCESYLNDLYKAPYFRRRSKESVINELKVMKSKYSFKEVMFFDSILFTDKAWLKDFLNIYKREVNIPFRCTGHVSFFDYEIARVLKEAGCYCIDFGVQTFNPGIRKDVLNRQETNKQIKEAFDVCEQLNLRYDVDLMFGLPGAELGDYLLPIEFMKEARWLNRLKCYYLSYFPKTAIIEKALTEQILGPSDVEAIERGDIGDWFHVDSIESDEHKRWKENFSRIYKIFPLLPRWIRSKIVKNQWHKYFYFIPNFIIAMLQSLIALKNKDYRFKIYINNYFYNFGKKILRKS